MEHGQLKKYIKTYGYSKESNTKFYEMAIGDEEVYAEPIPVTGKTPISLIECAVCEGIEKRVLGTAHFRFEGKKEADIYYHPRYLLAGEKVISLLEDNNIVGFRVCDIKVEGKYKLSMEHISQLRQLEITGKCYKLFSTTNSEIEHCENCKKVPISEREKADNGIMVLDEYWDGSDIFMFDYGLLSIIVTDKVKNTFEANGVNNVKFIPLNELRMR